MQVNGTNSRKFVEWNSHRTSGRRHHFGQAKARPKLQRIAVMRKVTAQVHRFGVDQGKLEAQLHERDFMVIRRMRAHGRWQTMAIDNGHDCHAFAARRLIESSNEFYSQCPI